MSGSTSVSRSPDASLRDALALSLAEGIGPARQRELVERHGSASEALGARREGASLRRRADRMLADAHARGLGALHSGDAAYPPSFAELPDPPPVLWVQGNLALLEVPLVAIVGTRRCTPYGERVARELAAALARAGVCVVSGMALGIDAAAHRAALESGGSSIAVLGTGVDVAYPRAHRELHARLAREGLVISEAPPGAGAQPGAFPRRNRIIAGLSPVLVVVEAGATSGALITARIALDLGRTIAAVPGPIDLPQSVGSNELLRDGAIVIASVADILALVGRTPPVRSAPPTDDPDAITVWGALADGALDMDALCARSRLPAARCLQAVTLLELDGRIECALTGEVRRR